MDCRFHLEFPQQMVLCDAIVLAGASVEAIAHLQDGGEVGAEHAVTDPDGEDHRLDVEGSPGEVAVTCSTGHGGRGHL